MIVSDLSISVVDPSEVWTSLKGVCHEIFDLHFFHDLNPSRPLINRLKYFRIRFRFRRDIWIFKKLHGVHPTAESDSTVCVIPGSQTLQCASYRGVRLLGVHHTADSDSLVCITPRSHENTASEKTLRCASHHGVGLRGVHHTAESSSAVCIKVSVLIWNFRIVISLWYLKILVWKWYCRSQIV